MSKLSPLAVEDVLYELGLIAIKAWPALARCRGLLLRGVHLAGRAARIGFLGTWTPPTQSRCCVATRAATFCWTCTR